MPELAETCALAGETVAQYRVIGCLGRGGMGEVYEAFDTRLRRSVALKFLSPRMQDAAESRRRLLREARAASMVSHPAIVGIFEIGEYGGRSFIAMEAVRGQVLSERMDAEGPMSLWKALDIATQIAEAMHSAHACGVIHRDLKPRNLMLTDQGRVKILDFGIARPDPMADLDTFDTEARRSSGGAIPGTLLYMSPEQLLGECVDRRSDIFSLGVVLFEMLTGRRPFEASKTSGRGAAAYLHRLIYREPRGLHEHVPGIPVQLERLVGKMLAKSPDDRYQTMADVADELRSVPSRQNARPGLDVVPRPTAGLSRSLRPALSVLAILWAYLLWLGSADRNGVPDRAGAAAAQPASRGAPPAVAGDAGVCLPRTSEGEASRRTAHALWQAGEQRLQHFDREGALEQAIACFEDAIKRQPDHAAAYSGLSRADWHMYRVREDDTWRIQCEANAREAVRLNPHLTHARVSLALAWILDGRLDEARQSLRQLARLDPNQADVQMALAESFQATGQLERQLEHRRRAVELRPESWYLWGYLGDSLFRSNRLEEAFEAYERSLELNPSSAAAHRNLAAIYHRRGDLPAAAEALQRSLEIQPTGGGFSNLGTTFFSMGYFREAANAYRDALEVDANDYLIWANLADAYRQLPGRQESAVNAYSTAIRLIRQLGRAQGPEVRSRLALYLARTGDGPAARSALANLDWTELTMPTVWFRLCLAYEALGDRVAALQALEQALDLGYPAAAVDREPELMSLRRDVRYHLLVASGPGPKVSATSR